MKSNVIHIAVASDSRYLSGAIGTLASIRLAVPLVQEIRVIFLHDRLTQAEQDRVHGAMAKLKSGPQVEFMKVDEGFAAFPDFYFDSTMPYARLVLPEKVSMESLIYIDVDVLVLKDLSELVRIELPENGVGGVAEKIMADDMPSVRPVELDPAQPYLNSGLLVLDVNKVRRAGTFAKALEILRDFPASCRWHDQSALNYVLNGAARSLDGSWNVLSQHVFFDPIDVMPRLQDRAINVHFIRKAKPWLAQVPFPAEQMFRSLLDAVDPGWREDPYVKRAMVKAKERFARVMPLLFQVRGWYRNMTGKDGSCDVRESGVWVRYNQDVSRLHERSVEFATLCAGWQAQIAAALVET